MDDAVDDDEVRALDELDPRVFRPDSLVGVPGLMEAYRAGNVALVNAPGTGIADDKAVYAYVAKIIRYYLGEDAILPNVPTWVCGEEAQCDHVLANLAELVVKPANESGGYGLVIGPRATLRAMAPPRPCRQPCPLSSTLSPVCHPHVHPAAAAYLRRRRVTEKSPATPSPPRTAVATRAGSNYRGRFRSVRVHGGI